MEPPDEGPFSRTELVIGKEGLALLKRSKVAVVGIGGVGSWAAEALARAGIGHLVLIDDDSVCITNINRQVIATMGSVGRPKVEAMRDRILDINPEAEVEALELRFGPDSAGSLIPPGLDYIVDAIDSISSKVALILRAQELRIPIVSAMGTGNKLDPTRLEVADISETSVCPLARVMRRELRKRGVETLKVIYSREEPVHAYESMPPGPTSGGKAGPADGKARRSVPGSISFVPPVAGLIAASVVVRGILELRAASAPPAPRGSASR
jgi:tRNA A37 threonylcarbamoyladenosine dehydratase